MFKDRTILVVVPARGGSKSVRLKNIRPVNGIPLVALVGRVVKQLPFVDRAVVSTEHPGIAKIAKESGLDVPFLRPDELSGDLVSDWEVLQHALLATENIDKKKYDVIVMLQPTCPLRKPEHVTAAVQKLIEGSYDAVWTISETDSKHHPLKQLVFKDNKLDYYDKKGVNLIARQQLAPVYHRNGAAYALTRQCLIEQKTIKGKNATAVIIAEPMISVDTIFDFEFVEWIIKNNSEELHKLK